MKFADVNLGLARVIDLAQSAFDWALCFDLPKNGVRLDPLGGGEVIQARDNFSVSLAPFCPGRGGIGAGLVCEASPTLFSGFESDLHVLNYKIDGERGSTLIDNDRLAALRANFDQQVAEHGKIISLPTGYLSRRTE